jgi:Domain of unknown function (DUF4150)/VRR-NUC domain
VSITVRATGNSICHKGSGGTVRNTIPDVCKTPTVPVPHTIVSFSRDLARGSRSVFADGGNSIAIKGSIFTTCTGDEPGVGKGVKSGTVRGESRWLTWSPTVYIESRNVCRLTDKMTMNSGNAASLGGLTQAQVAADADLIILCIIFCKCLESPTTSRSGKSDLRQFCVSTALNAGDQASGWKSVAKPEVPYNMTTTPPTPIMHRGADGALTTQPSAYWQSQAGNIEGYVAGTGMVRKPDVVLVRNPTVPPIQSNIRRIVEMKFPGDSWSPGQEKAYQQIAGAAPVDEMNEESCGCAERKKEKEPAKEPGFDWITAGLMVLAVVLIFTPIPGDEAWAAALAGARMGIKFAF